MIKRLMNFINERRSQSKRFYKLGEYTRKGYIDGLKSYEKS